jgi:hypothetical protein
MLGELSLRCFRFGVLSGRGAQTPFPFAAVDFGYEAAMLHLAARALVILILAASIMTASAAAQEKAARSLQATAQIVVSCRFDLSMARIGEAADAPNATASLITCRPGALAKAGYCAEPCAAGRSRQFAMSAHAVVKKRADGVTVKTILF